MIPTNIEDVEYGDMFYYNTTLYLAVKIELNMLGQYDVWATPVAVPRPIPDLHLVLDTNSALMLRA